LKLATLPTNSIEGARGQSWKKKIPAKINLPGAGETTNENQAQLRSEGLAMQKNWELQRTPA
jgi:hypothetical protein